MGFPMSIIRELARRENTQELGVVISLRKFGLVRQAFLKVAVGLKGMTFFGKFGGLTPTKTEEGHYGV
jgi:hypothetical protein